MAKEPIQLDVEGNLVDRAIRAVRDFQKGACTTSFVRQALKDCPENDLHLVATATRMPLQTIQATRGSGRN